MRVLFTGISGLQKNAVMQQVAAVARQAGLAVRVLGQVEHKVPGSTFSLLAEPIPRERMQLWRNAFHAALADFVPRSDEHALLALHATLFRDGQISSCIDWDLVRARYQPTICVTLIDDAYDILRRIHEEEKNKPTASIFRLREIFVWRSAEIAATDQASQSLYINPQVLPADWGQLLVSTTPSTRIHSFQEQLSPAPRYLFGGPIRNFVVAVKHPAQMLYWLLFRRDILRIYTSFPISRNRDSPKRRAELNRFLAKPYNDSRNPILLTIFNPLTIDELPLHQALVNSRRDSEIVTLDYTMRWSLIAPGLPLPMVYDSEAAPMIFPKHEIESLAKPPQRPSDIPHRTELKSDIERHVISRDFRLISQIEGLAAYRPRWRVPKKEGVSSGVREEITRARYSKVTKLIAFDPMEDLPSGGASFDESSKDVILYDSLREFWNALAHEQQVFQQQYLHSGIPLTWEGNF